LNFQKLIMNIKPKTLLPAIGFTFFIGLALQTHSAFAQRQTDYATTLSTERSIAPYFTSATTKKMTPDADGFIQRWLLLEPINKPNRGNTVFTDSYLRKAFDTLYFPKQFTILPKHGDKVKVGDQQLKWHALESTNFNVKLFRFAFGLDKQIYGVLFWAVTVI